MLRDHTFLFICFAAIAPWLLASWFRLPRYVGIMQHTGYHMRRYGEWLTNNAAESRFIAAAALIFGLLSVGFGCGFFLAASVIFHNLLLVGVIYLALLVVTWWLSPRGLHFEQSITPTARALRLIVTAFFAQFIPVIFGLQMIAGIYDTVFDPRNSPESMIVAPMFLSPPIMILFGTGPITFILTPFTVALANGVNFPVEMLIARIRR